MTCHAHARVFRLALLSCLALFVVPAAKAQLTLPAQLRFVGQPVFGACTAVDAFDGQVAIGRGNFVQLLRGIQPGLKREIEVLGSVRLPFAVTGVYTRGSDTYALTNNAWLYEIDSSDLDSPTIRAEVDLGLGSVLGHAWCGDRLFASNAADDVAAVDLSVVGVPMPYALQAGLGRYLGCTDDYVLISDEAEAVLLDAMDGGALTESDRLLANEPRDFFFNPTEVGLPRYVYAPGTGGVTRLTLDTGQITSHWTHPLSSTGLRGAAIMDYLWVATTDGMLHSISTTNPAQPQTITSIDLGSAPVRGVVFDPLDTGRGYVAQTTRLRSSSPDYLLYIDEVLTEDSTQETVVWELNGGQFLATASRRSGVSIFNVSSLGNPQLLESRQFAGAVNALDAHVDGSTAYLLGLLDNGDFFSLDVSVPSTPVTLQLAGQGLDVTRSNGHAFLAQGAEGITVIDLSNPAAPQLVTNVSGIGFITNVTVDSGRLFAWDDQGGRVVVYDVSDPTQPASLTEFSVPVFLATLQVFGNTFYVAGALDLHIYSAVTLQLIQTWQLPSLVLNLALRQDTAPNLANKGGTTLAFVSGGGAVEVFDVTDPMNVTRQASYETPGAAGDVTFDLQEEDILYVSDGEAGIQVLEYDAMPTPTLLQQFDAAATVEGVQLEWEIFSDEAVEGFVLLRTTAGVTQRAHSEPMLSPTARSFLDSRAATGLEHTYRLQAIVGGRVAAAGNASVRVPVRRDVLHPVRPNPFNPRASIRFDLARGGMVRISVYDARGQHVTTLLDDDLPTGRHDVEWNGLDDNGRSMASGVYHVRMQGAGLELSTKAVLAR